MTAAIIYCRVSTEEQVVEGISLEAQEQRLREYCAARGLAVAAVLVDAGVSAGKPLARRPAGEELLAALQRGDAGAVVAYKLDRLFRNAIDCLAVTDQWDRAGVALHLVDMGGQAIDTSTAMGRFFLTVMAGAAEMERNMISERTRAAMAHKRAKGERTSKDAPLGFALGGNGQLVESPPELRAVDRARHLWEQGHRARSIAKVLTAEGYEPRGKRWHPTTIARLLRRFEENQAA